MTASQGPQTYSNRLSGYWPTERRESPTVNVGDTERWASFVGGTTLALYGLSRGTLGGLALAAVGGCLVYRGATGHCDVYKALGVSTAERRGPRTSLPAGHGCRVDEHVTVQRPPEEVYRFWRNLENLPRFMRHLESVRDLDGKRSHWVAKGPLGVRAEWDAEIITERQNELIGWRSLPGSEVDTAGSVHFARTPDGRGTEIRVELKYDPPAGKAGCAAAKLLGEDPATQIREDLQTFRQMLETGSTITTQGQPRGGR
jgi:uncharacterized membrane protein